MLAAAVDAARAGATVGEMSLALERAWKRHVPEIRAISDVYAQAAHGAEAFETARGMVRAFAESDGRPPRILVAKIGQDGHDRGQKVIASAFADMGFDVRIGQLFATPEEVAAAAIEADVHVVGISSLTAGHMTLHSGLAGRARRRRSARYRHRRRRHRAARGCRGLEGDGCAGGLPAGHPDPRFGPRPCLTASMSAWAMPRRPRSRRAQKHPCRSVHHGNVYRTIGASVKEFNSANILMAWGRQIAALPRSLFQNGHFPTISARRPALAWPLASHLAQAPTPRI